MLVFKVEKKTFHDKITNYPLKVAAFEGLNCYSSFEYNGLMTEICTVQFFPKEKLHLSTELNSF